MVYVMNVSSLKLPMIGVNANFNKISKIGLVEIMKLTSLFKKHNLKLVKTNDREILDWIEYDRFENVKYLSKGGFGTIYKATWKDGNITEWDSENNQWRRINVNSSVVLKCLHNSQNITAEFLREVSYLYKILLY